MFGRLAQKNKIARVPFFLQGLTEGQDMHQWFQADRIHPKEEAQRLLLDNVWPVVEPLLSGQTAHKKVTK